MEPINALPYTALSRSEEETEALGAAFAGFLRGRGEAFSFVALEGDLGAGKTAFVRGVASVLAPGARVQSPTFALLREYHGERILYHFDLYRIANEDDLATTGYFEIGEGVILAEWSELIPSALPPRRYIVRLERTAGGETERLITIKETDDDHPGT
ncbi:MAG: tRNA (adenosine(37)-N6)-threonylcarbamoyltransferase complex ATPase subunit type 1 TsaE [Clostridia bacterium]|nr:tRNA (adenosine(37)-N6)-threonylcarbamoyltransferase complex ATPase subunit type 1 TsaE [Clostridia bacterium]